MSNHSTLRRIAVPVVAVMLSTSALAADTDGDGLEDAVDNCIDVPNAVQCDTDADGFGNHCDADYDQSGAVTGSDYFTFIDDFQAGVDSGVGTDSNCDGAVTSTDHGFVALQVTSGYPGPSGLFCAGWVPCVDEDHDGVADHLDNCTGLANASQCDTDQDGYGNHCDGDFDGDGFVSSTDFSSYFLPDYQAGVDSGVGTDMDCDGSVDAGDFDQHFLPQYTAGLPGPSALGCAGSAPCQAGDPDVTREVAFNDEIGTSIDLRTATDDQGRMHGVYKAGASGSPRIEYLSQASPTGALGRETIAQEGATGLDIAFDSSGRPCVVWLDASSGDVGYGCSDGNGFGSFDTGASEVVIASSAHPRLALDSQDQPHIGIYQHVHQVDPSVPNHRVHHVWRDGSGEWSKEIIPLPPEYQPSPTVPDPAATNAVCVAVDASDRVHFVLGPASDHLLKDPPLEDYLGALAHAVWHPVNGWESSEVIRADVGGGASPTERLGSCELELADDGTLHLAYRTHTDSGEPPGGVFYGRESGAGWSFLPLAIGDPSRIGTDDAGNAFLSSTVSPGDEVELLRIDASGSVHTTSLDAYFSIDSAVSVWNPAAQQTTCRVLETRRFAPPESRFVLTTIESCDEP